MKENKARDLSQSIVIEAYIELNDQLREICKNQEKLIINMTHSLQIAETLIHHIKKGVRDNSDLHELTMLSHKLERSIGGK